MRFNFLRQLDQNSTLDYTIAFSGNPIDDRGRFTTDTLDKKISKNHHISYDAENFIIKINNEPIKANNSNYFYEKFEGESALLDATTLDVPELILLTKFLFSTCQRIGYIYAEPESYKLKTIDNGELHNFTLSETYSPFMPIPGFTPELTTQKQGNLLVFLGFEPSRLSRALSPDEVAHIKTSSVVFGIPPFHASWEMHSLMQNAETLKEAQVKEVHFAGANDPLTTLNLIKQFAQSFDLSNERLILAPLGTKPAAIGVSLFSAIHDNVRIMYDFPKKLPDRTQGIGKIHHFEVCL